ncbi:hypothetical protein MFLO_06039 [Listeria floridensis FSL S10-1187]|uniref:Uncharacterized protein n=1 Tax=Listeria floridensis FSL S10-1187 TaxID=1265817 RepID=A0ABP3AZ85_9LIST|nr:hypothetical protein [Listeria floridensis]EUJ32829.1 hypothetical protein MFLO_06039 [Listeria floridensis FSL S10-1187]
MFFVWKIHTANAFTATNKGFLYVDQRDIIALADGDATEAEIRLKPKAEYEKAMIELKAIEQEFDETIQTTQKSIWEMVEKDQELAKRISEL